MWSCLNWPVGYCMNYLLFGLFNSLLLLMTSVKRVLLCHSTEGTHKLTVIRSTHSPESYNAKESLGFFFANQWGQDLYMSWSYLWGCHFIPHNCISHASSLILLCFTAKSAFEIIWFFLSSFLNSSSAVLPLTMMSFWAQSPSSSMKEK